MRRRSFLVLLVALCHHATTLAKHVYSDSFPTNDEYDFNILDVHHIYGSPYGGFGRATRSRLAALPLHLPGTVGEYSSEEEEEVYMEMTDGDGRLFACRVYHEDELTSPSLVESMFTTAQLSPAAAASSEDPVENEVKESMDENKETVPDMVVGSNDGDLTEEAKQTQTINQILSKLNGVCTQIHKGWWSYEWCHGKKVTQFHVHVEKGKLQQVQMESVTNLGEYATSTVYTDGDPYPEEQKEMNPVVAEKMKEIEERNKEEDPEELAVVVHEFAGGAVCEETGKPRRTQVKLKCCPLKRMHRLKRAVLLNGQPVASNIAAVTKMQETSVCNYSIEVCTPLLCEGLAETFEGNSLVAKEGTNTDNAKLVTTPPGSREKKVNESIRGTIADTLKNVCLTFRNGGWYVSMRRCDESACLFSLYSSSVSLYTNTGGSTRFVMESISDSFTRRISLILKLARIPEPLSQYTFSASIRRRISKAFQTRTNQSM